MATLSLLEVLRRYSVVLAGVRVVMRVVLEFLQDATISVAPVAVAIQGKNLYSASFRNYKATL